MSNKFILKVVAAFGLLAAVLLVLAVRYVPESSALAPASSESGTSLSRAGSGSIERHSPETARAEYFGESGRMERDYMMPFAQRCLPVMCTLANPVGWSATL